MSGPITPPLTVETVDGATEGRPITTIKVSNGDLTISGRTATIDTTGSGGSPATPANSVQFNSDPAGTFTGSDRLLFETDANLGQLRMKTGASATQAEIRSVEGWGLQLNSTTTVGDSVLNTISIQGEGDAANGIILVADNTGGTGENVVIYNGKLTSSASGTSSGAMTIASEGTGVFTLQTADGSTVKLYGGTNTNIELTPNGSGQNRLISETVVVGNGTAHAFISSNDAYDLVLETREGGDSPSLRLVHGANGGIILTPAGTGAVSIGGNYNLPTAVTSTNDWVLTAQTDGSTAWAEAGGGGASTLGALTDVSLDITNFTDSLLIQTDSDGSAPTTGTLSSASDNLGIGVAVFTTLESGTLNTAIGANAGAAITSGSQNSFYGALAGASLTTAWQNTFIGYSAGTDVESGYGNTAVGRRALYSATDGAYSVAVGDRAGYWTNSDKNIFIGHKSGYANPGGTGDNNIVVGANSVQTAPGSGEGNVALGQGEHTSATGDNQLLISSGQGSVNWIRGDSSGSCYQGDNATTWSTTSDQRLKREIVDATVGLDAINAVQVRNFRYIEKAEPIMETDEDGDERIVGYDGENRYDLDPEPIRVGVIAQEVMEVFPQAVKENGLGHLIVNPDSINWALIKAVQELSAKVEALEAMIE